MSNSKQIHWPTGFEPENSPIHVRNELEMGAAPDAIWAWLIRAQLWPTWYANSANITFLTGQPPDLALGTRFRWKTFSVSIQSKVLEFVPYERLSWDAQSNGLNAYHAWVIEKTDQGCRVVTEETERGWLARLSSALQPKRIEQQHQIWLEGLKAKASRGLPPAP